MISTLKKEVLKSADKSDGEITIPNIIDSGATISGDFFVDCTDGNSKIQEKLSMLGNNRTLKAVEHTLPSKQISGSCRRATWLF